MNSQVINVQLAGGREALLAPSQITMNIYRKPNLLILVLCASQKAFSRDCNPFGRERLGVGEKDCKRNRPLREK